MNSTHCPHCQGILGFDRDVAGALVKCRHCETVFRVGGDAPELGRTEEGSHPPQGLPTPLVPSTWQGMVLGLLGIHWALCFLFSAAERGMPSLLALMPLLGFAAPFVGQFSPGWRRAGRWVCFLQMALSPVGWLACLVSFMDPTGFQVRLFGLPLFTVWSLAGLFVYFVVRAGLFLVAACFIGALPAPAASLRPQKDQARPVSRL